MATSRAQRAVSALAEHLEEKLVEFNAMTVFKQWAPPETKIKGALPSGCVTCLGSRRELDGPEPYGLDDSGRTLTRLGSQFLTLQVDIWARTMAERFAIQAALEGIFDDSDGNDDEADDAPDPGAVTLTLDDGSSATYILGDDRFEDSPESAADREWRYSFDLEAEVDILKAEDLPTMDLAIRVRTEDDRRAHPEQIPAGLNVFGVELTRTTFRPEPE